MEALLPLTVALPLATAALFFMLPQAGKLRRAMDLFTLAVAAAVTVMDAAIFLEARKDMAVYWFGGWKPEGGAVLGISFAADEASAALAFFTGLLTVAALAFAWRYFEALSPYFHSLMLIFLASMTGFCLTGDLFNLFVFFELMGVAAYALTGYKIEDTGPLEGALNFAVMNSIGAVLVLAGIAMVYARTGALNMAQAGRVLAGQRADLTLLMAFGLLAAGFLVKGAVVPFHFWLPDAHGVAPTPVSVLFSGIMVELGIYAAGRIYWTVFHQPLAPAEGTLRLLLVYTGCLTTLLGGIMCLAQRHLKRLLAFSTVSHAGIMTIGVGLLTADGLAGSGLYLIAHGLVKGALFICTGVILHRKKSVDEDTLRGKCGRLWVMSIIWLAGGLALAGLPLFGTFAGKAMLEEEGVRLGFSWLPWIVMTGSACTGGAVLRGWGRMFHGWGGIDPLTETAPAAGNRELPETVGHRRTPFTMWFPAVALVVICAASALMPRFSVEARRTALRFTDTRGWQERVLEGKEASVGGSSPFEPQGRTIDTALAGVAAAAVIAAISLAATRISRVTRGIPWKVAGPVVAVLRRVHSGYVGDYVVWLVAGLAVLSATLALTAR